MEIRGIENRTEATSALYAQNRNDATENKEKETKAATAPPAGAATTGSGQIAGSSTTCTQCGASIPSSSSVCPKCGTKVESAAERLLNKLMESLSKANYTDNGVGTLTTLQKLSGETPEEEH